MSGVLYISYDGMLEPLGQSQVLAYLKGLAPDFTIHLLSFEKERDWSNTAEREHLAREIAKSGIVWHPLRYHKTPSVPATAYDIAQGIIQGTRIIKRHGLHIVHARSYVSALMAMEIKKLTGARLVFDMRGFWADERVDAGLWKPDSPLYRSAKWFEKQFLLQADHVVSLTHAAIREMQKFPYLQNRFPPYSIIPTCADLDRFTLPSPESRQNRPFTLGYVGSVGGWYLWEETLKCFDIFLHLFPSSRILIVNRGEHDFIKKKLVSMRILPFALEIVSAQFENMPQWISQMDATVFFIRPSFSKKASSPTKLAEFLGCGVPCLVNRGVGDMDDIMRLNQTGVVVESFEPPVLQSALRSLMEMAKQPETAHRCRQTALRHFSLRDGVESYKKIYENLM